LRSKDGLTHDRVASAPRAGRLHLALIRLELLLLKAGYNPNQPRVPAGRRDGGQWTSGDGNDTTSDAGEAYDAGESGEADPHVVLAAARKPGGLPKKVYDWTVRQFVSEYCKGSINKELPGQFEDVIIGDLIDMAKGGDAATRKCKKILEQPRFRKEGSPE
jgi:hypothetical protein